MTVDKQHPVPPRRHRRVPWSPRAWGQALYLAGEIPVLIITPVILVLLARATARSNLNGVDGLQLLLLWVVVTAGIVLLAPVLTRVHRHRLRTTAGVEIPPRPRRQLTWPGLVATVRSQATWRQLCYYLFAAPVLAAAAGAALGLWLVGVVYGLVYAYAWALQPSSWLYRHTFGPSHHPVGLLLTAAGLVALFAAPWCTSAVRALDVRAARALLGPSRADELEHRVEHLTQTRAGVVDAADAERRRLERDLHDGTQQRLVSLAINLGMARAQAGTAEEAKLAIAEAHEEAKAALAELRDLIRGLHPAVLEDRGLDAALSGIVARTPLPVRLTVDMTRRPAPVIEAVAYFVVSEGLSNIVKHAQATEAAVFVQRAGDRLHVIVTDDGMGGADPARGTGLAGLARRAASVDGTFEIDSPPGGPTLLTVDLPCNR